VIQETLAGPCKVVAEYYPAVVCRRQRRLLGSSRSP